MAVGVVIEVALGVAVKVVFKVTLGVAVGVAVGVVFEVALGVALGAATGVEVGTAIVMPTPSQKLSVVSIVSSISSDDFFQCKGETYSVNLLDCSSSRRLEGASL